MYCISRLETKSKQVWNLISYEGHNWSHVLRAIWETPKCQLLSLSKSGMFYFMWKVGGHLAKELRLYFGTKICHSVKLLTPRYNPDEFTKLCKNGSLLMCCLMINYSLHPNAGVLCSPLMVLSCSNTSQLRAQSTEPSFASYKAMSAVPWQPPYGSYPIWAYLLSCVGKMSSYWIWGTPMESPTADGLVETWMFLVRYVILQRLAW